MSGKLLWAAEGLTFSIGRQTLFRGASFSISEGERVAMVGRNGTGKSTLMRMIAGLEEPSGGSVTRARDLRVSMMPQDFRPEPGTATVRSAVEEGAAWFRTLRERYETNGIGAEEHERLERLLNLHDAWNPENKAAAVSERLGLPPPEADLATLSGGELRRVMLARAIVAEPDLLLLDEPTNHIDVDAVAWIEDFLASYRGACFLITHDRYFLDRIATRIVELDQGLIHSVGSTYAEYLETKAAREHAEDQAEARRASFLRREIEWVRRSPKARLRRNLGRIKRYYEIEAQSGPQRIGDVELLIPPPARLGNQAVELKDVSLSLGGRTLISHFSWSFTAKQKVGVIGPNGAGKTSLLKLLTGELPPDSGEAKIAETVEFNYVDQARIALDPEKTVMQEVAGDSDHVRIGRDSISVWTYLKRFLFEDERIKTEVKFLSGGEKARLILAKLLKRGGNFLILDEPTNDLDLSTLRVLEEALIQFPSALVVVSHDRYFLNRVCTHVIAFDRPDGVLTAMEGDYDYYKEKSAELAARRAEEDAAPVRMERASRPSSPDADGTANDGGRKRRKRLSYKEERELAQTEAAIPEAEAEVARCEAAFADPKLFAERPKDVPGVREALDKARRALDALYARWEELASKKESLEQGDDAP